MKKLLSAWFAFTVFSISACKRDNVSKMAAEVKVISKCYKRLSSVESKSNGTFRNEGYKTSKPKCNVSSVLPAYLWDTKMMIW